MNLYELITTYPEHLSFKQKFPDMFSFSREIKIIPWKEEYAVADSNLEEFERLKLLEKKLENSEITEEEFAEETRKLKPVPMSKTLAISFYDTKEVSFREEKPSFHTIIHELGHVYYKVEDDLWSSVYSGGEIVLWLIYHGKIKGDETSVRRYMNFLKTSKEDPETACAFLNRMAKKIAEQFGGISHIKNIAEFCFTAGVLLNCFKANHEFPDMLDREDLMSVVANLTAGSQAGEVLWTELLQKIVFEFTT